MAKNEVTRKDLFNRIAVAMADDPEVVEMCNKYIAQLAKPRKVSEKAIAEKAEWLAAVATYLHEQTAPVTQAMAGEGLGVSGAKAGAALRALVEQGVATVVESEEKRAPKMYIIA